MPNAANLLRRRAIVIGGSLAGMLPIRAPDETLRTQG